MNKFARKNNSVLDLKKRNLIDRYGKKQTSTLEKRNNFYAKRVQPLMIAERDRQESDRRNRYRSLPRDSSLPKITLKNINSYHVSSKNQAIDHDLLQDMRSASQLSI